MHLYEGKVTSHVYMCVLRDILKHWKNSIDDIFWLDVIDYMLELRISDASYLRFDVIEVLYVVWQESFEVLPTHDLSQSLQLGDQLVSDPPSELIRDQVKIGLKS